MGGGSWSDDAYKHIASSYAGKSTAKVFTSTSINVDMSPMGVTFRESRDSDEHPETVAIKIGLDETGSMGKIPEIIARQKMAALMPTVIKHGVPHPQVLFEGIGDHISDAAPLQVGQFESETTLLDKWLTGMYLEGNGGVLVRAATHFETVRTSTDTSSPSSPSSNTSPTSALLEFFLVGFGLSTIKSNFST